MKKELILECLVDLVNGLERGFELTQFKTIDRKLNGIQPGLYLLAGYPNAGKTNLLTNMTLDLLNNNPSVKILFFSLGDSRNKIISRLVAEHCNLELQHIRRDIQNDKNIKNTIEDAIEYLMKCNLGIYDNTDIDRFEQFENIISKTVREYKNTIVILDALYNLPQTQTFEFGREAHQERARALKQIVNRYNIPLIASSELRKPARSSENSKPTMHDLPEARDYAYNADLVWLLYYDTSNYKSYEEFKKSDNPLLTLNFDKNKISSYRGTVNLRFNRYDTTMEEVDCVEQPDFDITLR